MGNNVTRRVGNYVLTSRSQLGNYVIADSWSDTRKDGPCFVVARISVMDTIKVLERFPFTEDGWAQAWAALVRLDEGAAGAVRDRLAASKARGPADAGLAQLDAATVSYLPQVAFLGGYAHGTELAVGKTYDLRFLDNRLAVFPCRLVDVLVESSYSDVEAVEIGGPGLIKSGGGFIGGGVGLAGAAEGMAIAAALNALTTRTSIKTVLRIQAASCELFFLHTKLTPEQLRIQLSRPLGAIRAAQAVAQQAPHPSPIGELAKLASMLESGLLTRQEFDLLKAKLLTDS
jgi:hypothetical protein